MKTLLLGALAAAALAIGWAAFALARSARENRAEIRGLRAWPFVLLVATLVCFTYWLEDWSSATTTLLASLPITAAFWLYCGSLRGGRPTRTQTVMTEESVVVAFKRRRRTAENLAVVGLLAMAVGSWLTSDAHDTTLQDELHALIVVLAGCLWLGSMLGIFYVYRCPVCRRIPAVGVTLEPFCRSCGAKLV